MGDTPMTPNIDRRDVLKAAGAATALSGIGTASADGQQTHELCINAPNDRQYPYQFAVTGGLQKKSSPDHAPINPKYGDTRDPEDDLDGCRVHGSVAGGWDCYAFTGNIAAFSVPNQWAHKYTIYTNGHKRTAGELQTQRHPSEVACGNGNDGGNDGKKPQDGDGGQDDGFCPLKNRVMVRSEGNASEPVHYDIAVTGELELSSGERVGRIRGKVKNQAGGYFKVEFPYSGTLKCLKVEGPGHAELSQKHPCE